MQRPKRSMGMKKLGFRILLVLIVAVTVVQLKPNCANAGYIDTSFRILGMTVDDFNNRQGNYDNRIAYGGSGFDVPFRAWVTPFKKVPGINWYPDCRGDQMKFYAVDTNTKEIVGYFSSLIEHDGTPVRSYLAKLGDAFFDVSPDNIESVYYWNLNNGRLMFVVRFVGNSFNSYLNGTFNFYDWDFLDGIVAIKEGYDCLVNVPFPDRYVLEELQENIDQANAERAAAKEEAARKEESQAKEADSYIEQGLKLHAEKKYEEGDKAFEQAIELSPKNDKAYLAYNKAYAEKKDWNKMYEIMKRAVDAGIEKNAEVSYYYGLSLYKLIDPNNAFKNIFGNTVSAYNQMSEEARLLRKEVEPHLDFARKNCTDPEMKQDAEKWYSKTLKALQNKYLGF